MYVAGFDIGGTKCISLIAEINEEVINIIDRIEIKTETRWEYVLDKLCINLVSSLKVKGISLSDIKSLGISCGGPLDGKNGIIKSPPNLPGWDNVPIVTYLNEKLNLTVRLKNDADACALAEWKYGAGRGYDNVIFLTFGTGLGAGLILNGKLYTGTCGMAGELGHIRLADYGPVGYGKRGSFEGFCSGGGIKQIGQTVALELLQKGTPAGFCPSIDYLDKLDAKSIAQAADHGDNAATEVYRICGYYFGKGLSILIDLLNPDVIIAGSIFTRSHNLIWEETLNQLKKECLSINLAACEIKKSSLGEKLGDFAAIISALDL